MKVLYEDPNFLVIDKPSGIFVHPGERTKEETVLDLLLKKYPGIKLSHRLDKETSGVLILSKNEKAYLFLKKQFSAPALEIKHGAGLADRQAKVKKVYIAIVNGWVKNDKGIVNKPIGRSPKDFRRRLSGRGARGEMREAVTEYKVLKRLHLPINTDISGDQSKISAIGSFSLVELKPKTGRTHQIRVHMKFLNHPIACDSLYNPSGTCPAGLSRLALHAKSIEFKNLAGKTIKVESPLPKELKKIVK
jgi:23S rRNA pseudouridine1911/1915/1917 synthase